MPIPPNIFSNAMRKLAKALGKAWRESEETEVKNIEWLKVEVHKELESWHGVEGGIDGNGINEIMLLIDQLDESETLSQKWIDDNKEMYLINDTSENAVPDYKLQNLLVPKQELPVIPKFVADWIEAVRNHYSLGAIFHDAYNERLGKKDIEIYIFNNQNTFARAWLDGYTVEEEQKYVIKLKGMYGVLAYHEPDDYFDVFDVEEIIGNHEWQYQFTEQEIKDYDERYWPFAVPVEGLEK